MARNPIDPKRTMLLHSEAKVEFFKKYLERYLRILYLAPTIAEINVFDVFCGTGVYDNEKKGSPIVAFESIAHLRAEYGFQKTINLLVNDSKAEKVEAVRQLIDKQNRNYCSVSYYSRPADEMFEKIAHSIAEQTKNARNLVFLDPYGYKEIKKSALEQLLQNNRSEIILFLPISQMQRFTATAVTSDLKPYEPLKKFVGSFFAGDHPIKQETVNPVEYIKFVKDALRFDRYYSTSYFIKRDEVNYYALFFMSPHIYGFEKILEVKWQLDEEGGRGFKQPEAPGLFDIQDKELQKRDNYIRLEKLLLKFLGHPRTNQEIYEEVLKNEFLPKHAAEIFRAWQHDQHAKVEILEAVSKEPVRKGSFYVTWEWYNPAKNPGPRVIFKLK